MKHLKLNDYISSQNFDIFCIIETWLGNDTDATYITVLPLPGYAIKHKPMKVIHGGGVSVVYKESISPSQYYRVNKQATQIVSISNIV